MAVKSLLARKILGFVGALATRLHRATIDWKALYFDPHVDPVHPRCAGRHIYICWHEVLYMPISMRGRPDMMALASKHGDGDIISRAMQHLGWSMARGSSTRGGVTALLRFLRDDARSPTLTPDGPRGPRRKMSAGTVFMASKLGLPVVCAGYGADRPWRLNSWDRFVVPRPFSRVRAIYAPPLRVPAKLDKPELEGYRLYFERLLTWLTDEADAWAVSGKRHRGEVPFLLREAPPGLLQWTPEDAPRLPDDLLQEWKALNSQCRDDRQAA